MADRWMEDIAVADLVEAERNAKAHDEALIDASLDRFGYIEPIVVDERTGRIISGHGRRERLLAAQAAGDTPPEGVSVDAEGRWVVKVVRGWASSDDAEAEAAGIALNRIGEQGGWRQDVLADMLGDLARESTGLAGLGYTHDDLADLVAMLAPVPTLDELSRELGDPNPTDFWPVLRLRCPPDVRARFVRLVGALPEDEQLGALVDLAERASADAA